MMRKVILLIVVYLISGTAASYAQLTKEQRKEITQASKSQLNKMLEGIYKKYEYFI